MKTDKQLYQIFAAKPEWLFELTGIPSPGKSELRSVALKAIEQTADALVIPDDSSQPLTIAEFQFQLDVTIYARTVIAMALTQLEHDQRRVRGMILFRSSAQDPDVEPWNRVVDCFHLDELLEKLKTNSPEHPLVAVFQPLMERSDNVLERQVVKYFRAIRDSELDESCRTTLIEVFASWLEQRFRTKSKQEIELMFQGELPDLRETQSGKDLIAIGREEGREEGRLEGLRHSTRRLVERRFGHVPPEVALRLEQCESADELESAQLRIFDCQSPEELFEDS